MTVDAIQDAIRHLSESERRRISAWLEELEAQTWDEEIERDFSPGGRGTGLLDEVKKEIEDGKALTMQEPFTNLGKPRA